MRTWKCHDCGHTEEISYDWLAEHGGPVCEKCDCDLELEPTLEVNRIPAPRRGRSPLLHRDLRFNAVRDRQTRTISVTLATFLETDAADDVDRSQTADVLIEQSPCHLRIILDPQGEDHDLLIEQRADRWVVFAHVPGGGDPFCIIETNERGAVLLDGEDGRELLTRGAQE
jgi:hypothetical protein